MPSLRQLAQRISALADQLETLKESVNPDAAYSQTGLRELPGDAQQTRLDLIDSLQEMKREVQGAESTFMELLYGPADVASLLIIHDLNLPQRIPPSGSISYADLTISCNGPTGVCVEEATLRRAIRYVITNGIFREPEPDHVAHSELSLLLRGPGPFDLLGLTLQETLPALLRLPDAMKCSKSIEPNTTAYNIAHGTDLPMYRYLQEHPERAERFARAMSRGDHANEKLLLGAFPWADYDRPDTTVVDVGGGTGNAARSLVSSTKHMRCVVQDVEQTVTAGKAALPTELQSRIEFTVHDFFEPQPTIGADVFLFARIFHNWSDKYCLQILRALVPAMKTGAKVLIYEHVFDAAAEGTRRHKVTCWVDMTMLTLFNGCIRSESQWKDLLGEADARFVLDGVRRVDGCALSLVEATWAASSRG